MKKVFSASLCLVLLFSCRNQVRNSLEEIGVRVEIMDSIKVYEISPITSGTGGDGVSTIDEVNRRVWIMENASIQELKKLTEYPNGNVKAIAYEGILRKNGFEDKKGWTIKALDDTIFPIYYNSGCFVWERSIGEYLVQDVLMIDDSIPSLNIEHPYDFGLTKDDEEVILRKFYKEYTEKLN